MQNDVDIVTVPVEVEHTATVPVEAIGTGGANGSGADPQLDPNKLIEADVAIAQTEAQTEQARIASRTAVRIAEIQAEEPAWLNDIRECLMRLETKVEALESRQSSTLQPSTVIVTEPEAPTVVAPKKPEQEHVDEEGTPELNEVPDPEAPVARRRRWI